jgi:hypothetical protein
MSPMVGNMYGEALVSAGGRRVNLLPYLIRASSGIQLFGVCELWGVDVGVAWNEGLAW